MSEPVRVCSVSEIGELGTARFVIDSRPIVIVRDSEGVLHALDDTCTHGNASLSQGDVEGCAIECWLHGATFDLVTGQPTPPATVPVAVYPLEIEGDDVLVRLERIN